MDKALKFAACLLLDCILQAPGHTSVTWSAVHKRLESDSCGVRTHALDGHTLCHVEQDSLAERSQALASGASPEGRGFEPHSFPFPTSCGLLTKSQMSALQSAI